ncbi:YncE family protein, partial [Rhodococcus cerastii]|nr:YncE family protein [Rhodococcus cerastii]
AIAPDGSHAYVTNSDSNGVLVIDIGTNSAVSTIPVAENPFAIAITPNGAHAYITHQASKKLQQIQIF